jgi:ribose transport system substrate-binding protein
MADNATTVSGGLSRRELLTRGGIAGLGLAAGSLLAACTDAPEQATPAAQAEGGGGHTGRKVIFVTHDLNPFFIPVIHGFETFGELRGWETQFLGPPTHDVPGTVQAQENAVAARPDALGLTRTDTTSFDATIERAQSEGIKVVLFNTASDGYKDLGLAYVGQEFVPAGRINGLQAARHAHELTGRDSGLIVMGTIAPGHSALEQRMEGTAAGVEEYNAQNGTTFETESFETSTDQAEAVSRIEAKWSADGDRIVGFAHADFVHWFTGIWLADRGLEGQVANGGFDLVPGVIEAIEDGTAQWSIGQNPYAQGFMASALLDMEMEAGFPAFDYDTGAEVVDASNIEAVAQRENRFSEHELIEQE